MSNEIQLYSKLDNPIEAIQQIGHMFAKSGMFGCEREEQGQILAMICLAEHKSPVAITRDFDIVEGKLRKKALAALADFRAMGGKHIWLSSGDTPAEKEENHYAELQLTDKEGNTIKYRYSMADARAEGLIKDRSRWVKRPGNMLRARCISNGLGMLCPELYAGDDAESDSAPSDKSLNLQPPTVTAAPAPVAEPKPAKVVELKPVSPDEKEEAKMGLAPLPKDTAPTRPAESGSAPEPKNATSATTSSASGQSSSTGGNSSAPAAEPKPFAAGPKYDSANKTLPKELVDECEKAIADNAQDLERAYKWMVKEGWLAADQDISFLSEARARRIIKQRDSFRKAVKEANL